MNQDLWSTNWHITALMSNFASGRRRVAQDQTCSIAFNPITNWKARRFFNISDFRQTSAVPPWGFRSFGLETGAVHEIQLVRQIAWLEGSATLQAKAHRVAQGRLSRLDWNLPMRYIQNSSLWSCPVEISDTGWFWRKSASTWDLRTAHAVSTQGF
jgi:hypothetical protein